MAGDLNAEIIAIGTEILLGEITDTNSVHIAQELRNIGVNLYFMTSVGDNLGRIADAIRIALSRAQIVITCGGLGPTVDDMTREGVAAASGHELTFHQALFDQIAARFSGFKMQMTENNRRQAYLPAGAIPIPNPVGTAPSFIVETENGGAVISLPGVPREMKYLMAEAVIPYLRGKHELGVIKARVLRTAGIGESTLDDLIGRDLLEMSNPTVGLAAHSGQVDVRVTAKAASLEAAQAMIDEVETAVRARVGAYIYGYDKERLEDVLLNLLKTRGLRLAVVEAGLGDAIRYALRNADPETLLAARSYANPTLLQVEAGLPDEIALLTLAQTVAERLQADTDAEIVIAALSLPDVDENADVAESTSVVVRVGERQRARSYGFGGQSQLARVWVTTWSLAAVWGMLHDADV